MKRLPTCGNPRLDGLLLITIALVVVYFVAIISIYGVH